MNENNIADFICEIKRKLSCSSTFNLQVYYSNLFNKYLTNNSIDSVNKIVMSKLKIEAFKTYLTEKIKFKQKHKPFFLILNKTYSCIGIPEIKCNNKSPAYFIINMMHELNTDVSTTDFFLLVNYNVCKLKEKNIPTNINNIDKAVINAFINYLNYLHDRKL